MTGKSDKRFFYQIWHRRSGKDKVNMADVVPSRLIQDSCLVKYVLPTLVMGRDNIWEGIGKDGFRFMDHIPSEIRIGKPNDTRMTVRTQNAAGGESVFQVAGTNNPDSLRGGNPRLYVFSEWAEHDPYAWDVVEPILRENDGLGIFNTTPKGDNHARGTYEFAKDHPLWWVQKLTVEDTKIFTADQMKQIREDAIRRFESQGRSEAEANAYIEQEYYCSFDSPVIGSYYGAAISKAERDNRITTVSVDQSLPVHTAWDLGMDDSTTIWMFQVAGSEMRFVDYYENSGEGLAHYAHILQQRGYVFGKHYAPHDIAVRELGTGKSRLEIARSLGIRFEVASGLDLEDGINATRLMLANCWFDKDKCYRGIQGLKNYKKDWDEKNMVFRSQPLHNWASHPADALRTCAVGYKRPYIQQNVDPGGIKPFYEGIPG